MHERTARNCKDKVFILTPRLFLRKVAISVYMTQVVVDRTFRWWFFEQRFVFEKCRIILLLERSPESDFLTFLGDFWVVVVWFIRNLPFRSEIGIKLILIMLKVFPGDVILPIDLLLA